MSKPFECSSGTYTGDGSSGSVTLGFKPKLLIIMNVTDGDKFVVMGDDMDDGSGMDVSGAAMLSTNGITLSATGFSVGSDAEVNENLKVFHYIAIGGN